MEVGAYLDLVSALICHHLHMYMNSCTLPTSRKHTSIPSFLLQSTMAHALVFGASGISGHALVTQALSYPTTNTFAHVTGLTNRPLRIADAGFPDDPRLQLVSGIDLTRDVDTVVQKLKSEVKNVETVSHVFFTAYIEKADFQDASKSPYLPPSPLNVPNRPHPHRSRQHLDPPRRRASPRADIPRPESHHPPNRRQRLRRRVLRQDRDQSPLTRGLPPDPEAILRQCLLLPAVRPAQRDEVSPLLSSPPLPFPFPNAYPPPSSLSLTHTRPTAPTPPGPSPKSGPTSSSASCPGPTS